MISQYLRQDPERGSSSVLVLGLIVALMVVAGLVVDGGRAVNARAEIMDDAEQAARAGANQVDLAALRAGGEVAIDRARARQVAVEYLTDRGYSASRVSVQVTGAEVSVAASDTVPTALLAMIFVNSFEVEGSAVARAAAGITQEIGTGAP